jgi:putative peptidoglycan lipid II flippase
MTALPENEGRLASLARSAVQTLRRRLGGDGVMRAAVVILGLSVFARALGLVKDLRVAAIFGVSAQMDAFNLAQTAVLFFIGVTATPATSSLISALPKAQDTAARKILLESVLGGITLTLLVLCALNLALASPLMSIIGSGVSAETHQLSVRVLRVMTPVLLLSGLTGALTGVLHARSKFAAAGVLQGLRAVGVLLAVTLFPQAGVTGMTLGLVAGHAVELVCLLALSARLGVTFRPRWPVVDAPFRSLGEQYVSLAWATAVVWGIELVDQSMSTWLGPGNVTSMSYGFKLVSIGTTLLVGTVGSALFPRLAQLVAQKDFAAVEAACIKYARLMFLGAVPVTATLIVFSTPITRLLLLRGAVQWEDIQRIAILQAVLAVQIPFVAAQGVIVRCALAMDANSIVRRSTAMNFVLNIALNALLMQFLGLLGIALSTTLVSIANYLYLQRATAHLLRSRRNEALVSGDT